MPVLRNFASFINGLGEAISEDKRRALERELRRLEIESERLEIESERLRQKSVTQEMGFAQSEEARAAENQDYQVTQRLLEALQRQAGTLGQTQQTAATYGATYGAELPTQSLGALPPGPPYPGSGAMEADLRSRFPTYAHLPPEQQELARQEDIRARGLREASRPGIQTFRVREKQGAAREGREVAEHEVRMEEAAGRSALRPIQQQQAEAGLAQTQQEIDIRKEQAEAAKEKATEEKAAKETRNALKSQLEAGIKTLELGVVEEGRALASLTEWVEEGGPLSLGLPTQEQQARDEAIQVFRDASMPGAKVDQTRLTFVKAVLGISKTEGEKLDEYVVFMRAHPEWFSPDDIELAVEAHVGISRAEATATDRSDARNKQSVEDYVSTMEDLQQKLDSGLITQATFDTRREAAIVRLGAANPSVAKSLLATERRGPAEVRAETEALNALVKGAIHHFEAILLSDPYVGKQLFEESGKPRRGGFKELKEDASEKDKLEAAKPRQYVAELLISHAANIEDPEVQRRVVGQLAAQYRLSPTGIMERLEKAPLRAAPIPANEGTITPQAAPVQVPGPPAPTGQDFPNPDYTSWVRDWLRNATPEAIVEFERTLDRQHPKYQENSASIETELKRRIGSEAPTQPEVRLPAQPAVRPPTMPTLQPTGYGVPGQKLDMPVQPSPTSMAPQQGGGVRGLRPEQLTTLTQSKASTAVKRRILEKVLGPGRDYDINRIMRGFSSELV